LVVRDLTARYRRSILGPLWAVIQPLMLMILFNLIRGVVEIPSDGVPYVIFSYAALVPWTYFSNAASLCGPSVITNAGIIKKMSVPREVFPVAAVIVALVDFLIAGLILFGMMIWFRVPFTLALVWLPVLIALTALMALGVGMGIAALGTFKRDFIFATPFLMQFWLYATPIIYPLSSVPDSWRGLYVLNPAVGLIEGYRRILIHGQPPDFALLTIAAVMIALIVAVGWTLFRRISQYFADVL
jgi:lipopolysaccharide transport system permease protein